MCITAEPSNEGNLSLGFIQLRTHQHQQRNTTNAWYETSNHLTSTCDTNDQAKQCNSTRHVIKQCNSARHVIRLISGGIETKPSQSPEFIFILLMLISAQLSIIKGLGLQQ